MVHDDLANYNGHLGEYLDLYTERKNTHYIVDEIRIVPPEDVSVLAPRAGSSITLMTCYPFYFVGSAPLALHRSRLNNECNQSQGT
jgi:LPXTG-site transpeptidase (sortase) family protein